SPCDPGRRVDFDDSDHQRLREYLAHDAGRSIRCHDDLSCAGLLWHAESAYRRGVSCLCGDAAVFRDDGVDRRETAAGGL
ncbi:MAG: hypothetical protein AVDCRST_MAG93-557, partial [uncultured Chloroflexia bacterium]